MITTVHVQITWPSGPGDRAADRALRVEGGPMLRRDPVERLKINDPRVLLGAQRVLAGRTGVNQAPDLVSGIGIPYFAVALEDQPKDMFGSRVQITALIDWLTEPLKFNVIFAEDGGWKTVLCTLHVEVMG